MAKNSMAMTLTMSGTDIGAWLSGIDVGRQKRILREGLKTAVAPMITDAKSRIKNRTGALKRSIDVVVRDYPSGKFVAVVGPKNMRVVQETGPTGRKRLRKAGIGDKKEDVINPANYGHLVEFGHRSVHGGGALPNYGQKVKGVWNSVNVDKSIRKGTLKATSFVAPRPFLTPAFESGKANAQAALEFGVVKAIDAETKRIQKRIASKIKVNIAA